MVYAIDTWIFCLLIQKPELTYVTYHLQDVSFFALAEFFFCCENFRVTFAKVIVKNVFEILSNSFFFCKLEYWQVIELVVCFAGVAVKDVDLEYVR